MMKLGLVGWRGMVGSVLMQRMVEEGDFEHVEPLYFSTSAVGGKAPLLAGKEAAPLQDAMSIEALSRMDIVITCQGGDYTKEVFPRCVPPAGEDTGSTPLRPCACTTTP
ncbi:MAG: hypothetical protein V5B38_18550 [Candidatus Accumulibacter propinquus]|jgi:aspartate-semialdehyde dehydrogenase